MTTVILTRSRQDNDRIAPEICSLGYEVESVPLLAYHYEDVAPIARSVKQQDYSVFIITSQQALLALEACVPPAQRGAVTVLCVGAGLRAQLQARGFMRVQSWDIVRGLYAHLCAVSPPPCCYLSGQHLKVPLAQDLSRNGIICDRYVVYRAEPQEVTKNFWNVIEAPAQQVLLLFYSRRTAQILCDALAARKQCLSRKGINAVVISHDITEVVRRMGIEQCFVAPRPTHDGMMQVLREQL